MAPAAQKRTQTRFTLPVERGRLRCASVETVVEVGTLVVRGGGVPTVVDRDSLAAAMGDGGAGWRPRLDVAVEPWPHCEARLTLADPLERAGGLSVAIKGGEVLKEGQSLVLDVVTPDYPSHLTVSYIQADGRVVHLGRYGGRLEAVAAQDPSDLGRSRGMAGVGTGIRPRVGGGGGLRRAAAGIGSSGIGNRTGVSHRASPRRSGATGLQRRCRPSWRP